MIFRLTFQLFAASYFSVCLGILAVRSFLMLRRIRPKWK